MSPRRNTRPLASTGVSATALAPSSAPVTRSGTRCAAGLQHAGRHDRILPRQGLEHLSVVMPSVASLACRELDEDLLVLRAVEVDFGDVLDLEKPLAKRLGDLLHLRVVGAVGREHVENRVDVAVLVIDVRADQVRPEDRP